MTEPETYNFKNWDKFYDAAVLYHAETRPNKLLLNHRIETFRNYMSGDVVVHLGSLVVPHPRYDTTEGWESWVMSVSERLSSRDSSARKPVTIKGWVTYFKGKKVTATEFWSGLDKLVSQGVISSEQQRQLFWDAHSKSDQEKLRKTCRYFDPALDIWATIKPSTSAVLQQRLATIMELSLINEAYAEAKCTAFNWIGLLAVIVIAFFSTILLATETWPENESGELKHAGLIFPFLGWLVALFLSGVAVFIAILPRIERLSRLGRARRHNQHQLHIISSV